MKRILLILSLLPQITAVWAKKKPNVILIVTDDQAYETMHCWGGKVYTPNIDRLANEGMKFNRAYVASPISAASRYSILSGRYCGRCEGEQFLKRFPAGSSPRIDNTVMVLEKEKDNLPKLLQANGYKTGMVGKWHLGFHFEEINAAKRKVQWEKAGLQYYDIGDNPKLPEVKSKLEHNHNWYVQDIKRCGFDYVDNVYWGNLKEVYNDSLNYHNIDWTVKGALDFIDQAGDNPFFLYFSTTLQHGPFPRNSVSKEKELVTGKGFASQKMGVLPDRETLTTRLEAQGIDKGQEYTLWLDDAVGAILSRLEEKGEADNTLIIYISDHGISQKASLYEGGVRTPMMVWWKNNVRKEGSVCSRLVHTTDFLPTILEAAGVDIPDKQHFDGVSFIPLLSNPDQKWRSSLFSEIGWARSVITEQYKYIAVRYPEVIRKKVERGLTVDEKKSIGYITNQGLCSLGKQNPNYFDFDQLYDMVADPYELHNLARNNKNTAKLEEMKLLMKTYLQTFINRPFGELYDGVFLAPSMANSKSAK